jgi:large subunit ribosomal protein L4
MDQKSKTSPASQMRVVTLSEMGLPQDQVPASPIAIARYIRLLRQNWRQGTVSCKDRSEVSYSNRKPWKQKGTGRARAGAASSPLWRHGGVIFGPQPRTRVLSLPVKIRRNVMRSLLHNAIVQGRMFALEQAIPEEFNTRDARLILQQAGLWGKKVALLTNIDDTHIRMAFANIPEVSLYLFDQLNAYALGDAGHIVYFQNNLNEFKEVVQSWI